MTSCQEFEWALPGLVDGPLPNPCSSAVLVHLAGCPRCTAELERYRLIRRLARSLPDLPPPPSLLARFRAAVALEE
jgi:anti-sigma factor RsiW